MSAELLVLALVLTAAAYILLVRWTRRRRRALGIGEGTIVSADDSLIRAPTLRSARLGLVGRCDHLLRVGNAYVPVEQKPSARRLSSRTFCRWGRCICWCTTSTVSARPTASSCWPTARKRGSPSRRSSSAAWCGRWPRCGACWRPVSHQGRGGWRRSAGPAVTTPSVGVLSTLRAPASEMAPWTPSSLCIVPWSVP